VKTNRRDAISSSRLLRAGAFDAIAATLPLGSVGYEREPDEKGERLIWVERRCRTNFYPSQLGDGDAHVSSASAPATCVAPPRYHRWS
jgi:hypothetical protein